MTVVNGRVSDQGDLDSIKNGPFLHRNNSVEKPTADDFIVGRQNGPGSCYRALLQLSQTTVHLSLSGILSTADVGQPTSDWGRDGRPGVAYCDAGSAPRIVPSRIDEVWHLDSFKAPYSVGLRQGPVLQPFYFIVPESLSQDRQQAARDRHRARRANPDPSNATGYSWKALNPISLIAPLNVLLPAVGEPGALFPNRHGANATLRRNIILLATMDTVVFGVATGTAQVIIIYAEYMFNWGNVESSLYVSIVNAVRAVVLLLVLPILSWFFRTPSDNDGTGGSNTLDIVLIRLSIVCDFLGYIGYALSRYSFMVICSGTIASLGGMGVAALQSSLTKHVPHERVGHLLGAMGLLHALARIIAPTLFNLTYSLTVATCPQAVLMFLTVVFGLMFCMSLLVQPYGTLSIIYVKISTNRSIFTLEDKQTAYLSVDPNEHEESEHDPLLVR
ncbi:hypothetical protein ABOM_000723 [Aspergillus bombycis]|uniref:Tetracycline-efflux transporter n=1 Tax=Aspergillus bombycis TaxID=109264 RepID=A0A1F8AGZ8_9EURO|nr:hypothetical protein ABOM_000723 [Aspergillus bombycis]OGM50932.1 hypothetical protein ABOM_000723 [Aspergillus bombycis]